jgi:outer membrane protein TolC
MNNKRVVVLSFLLMIIGQIAFAQSHILDKYVAEGLLGNKVLKQQDFQLQKAIYSLQEAKSLFMPSVAFNTTYTTAQGGRTIDIPVGDLVNPVYTTLNYLTKTNSFPQISNSSEQLFPKNFYDVRFKTQMPLFNAEIKYNQAIRKEQVNLQKADIQVYRRELTKDIKIAYFNFLKASDVINVYENALQLLHENERVNKSLIENGMANPTVLLRTQNEISRMIGEQAAAINTLNNTQVYLNFLLNRDLMANIQKDTLLKQNTQPILLIGKREELNKLETAIGINQQILGMNKAYSQPKVGMGLDLGSQGFLKNVESKNLFVLFGLSIDLPIYQANRNQLKIKQTEADLQTLTMQLEQAKEQLQLQVQLSQNSYEAARKIYESKNGQVNTAQRYHRDMLRRYKEGQANYIELLDAQTQITTAHLQQTITLYDVWIRWAELERAKASIAASAE